ncbi:trans-sulfuration enzyme family protein [Candidatus Zixiibacteriota bacterium]
MSDAHDMDMKRWGFATKAIHGPGGPDPLTGAVSQPIYQTSTFAFRNAEAGAGIFAGEEEGYVYTRISNPTVNALETTIALLEGGEKGIGFASGMAATSAVIFALCSAGQNIVLCEPVYGGTHSLVDSILPRVGIEGRLIDALDLDLVRDSIDENTALVWIETPANPTLKVVDISAIGQIAAEKNVPMAVDNTFATPLYQRPLDLGASLVIHSCTKYISGHGDVVAGMVVTDSVLGDKIRSESLRELGGCLSPFDAFLLIRGLKTLPVRMLHHSENAALIADHLAAHPKVERVDYPGRTDHPQHEIAARQMSGFGGMVTFYIKGGRADGARFLNNLKLCTLAVSLGDADTLIEHPASMTHSTYAADELIQFGITDNLIRISVGLETMDDIMEDLDQAFSVI